MPWPWLRCDVEGHPGECSHLSVVLTMALLPSRAAQAEAEREKAALEAKVEDMRKETQRLAKELSSAQADTGQVVTGRLSSLRGALAFAPNLRCHAFLRTCVMFPLPKCCILPRAPGGAHCISGRGGAAADERQGGA